MPYQFLDFDLDPLRSQLTRRGEPVDVPRQIFELILLLIRHRDRPVPKEEILATIWHGRAVTDASLTHAIATARRLLGDSPKSQAAIKTMHKRGYWWVAETRETFAQPLDVRGRPFVGRREEIRSLIGALDEAVTGKREFVLVVGEAGVGKTSLLSRSAEALRRDGSVVISACAEDLSPTPPLYLWRQVLSQLESVGILDTSVQQLLDPRAAQASKSTGATERRDTDLFLESVAAKLRLFESLASALLEASRRARLAIMLEDLHTADGASIEALHYLVNHPTPLAILFVGTHRPILPTQTDALLRIGRLARSQGTRSIVLRNLSPSEVREFLDCLSDEKVPTSRADKVFRASAGNPFLVWQLVALARARGGIDAVSSTDPLPSTIRTAIAAHTDGLSTRCREILRVAAVAGQAFDLLVLSAAVDEPPAVVSTHLKSCIDAGIVRPRSAHRLEFTHALLRDALYDEVDPHERVRLHLTIGRAMKEILGAEAGDHLPSMASHFRQAANVGGREQAIATLRTCGDLAARNLAFQDASMFLSDALALSYQGPHPEADLQCRLMLSVGSARLCAGDRAGAREVLLELTAKAAATQNGELLAEAALSFAPSVLSLEVGVIDNLLIDTLESSLALPLESSETRTELAGRLALALYWADDDQRRTAAESVLASAAESESAGERERALLFRLGSNWSPDDLPGRRLKLDILDRERGSLPSSLAPVVRVYRVATFLEANALPEMDMEIHLLEGELRASGVPYCAWYPKMFRATQALYRGEFDLALNLAQEYVTIGQQFEDSNVANSFAAQWGEVQWLRGNAAAAMEPVETLAHRFPAMVEWRCVVVFFLVLAGRQSEALSRIDEMLSSEFAFLKRRRNMSFVIGVCVLAEAASRLRLRECASPLYDLLLPYRGRNAVGGYGVLGWGSVSRFLGEMASLAGRGSEAIGLLEEALVSDTRAGSDSWMARSEIALARTLLVYGSDARRATNLASEAKRRAGRRGLSLLAAEAEEIALQLK